MILLESTGKLAVSSCEGRYLVDVFALEFSEEFGQSLVVSIDSDAAQDFLDIGLRGRSSVEGEKKVCREMFHFICFLHRLDS